jgi:hypothetical protein
MELSQSLISVTDESSFDELGILDGKLLIRDLQLARSHGIFVSIHDARLFLALYSQPRIK